jgi:hypothetical protein
MSFGRFRSSGFSSWGPFFVSLAVAAVLSAFLSGAGADDDVPVLNPMNTGSDDVTSSAKAEPNGVSNVMVKVSYKREGENQSRLFLIPRELATRMDGGLSGTLEVRSLVLASNGEPKQLILDESREGKQAYEVEFQLGWNGSGTKVSCTLLVQASSGANRDLGEPVEDPDCRHFIFNPEAGSKHSKRSI